MKKEIAFVVLLIILMAFSSFASAYSGADYTNNELLAAKLNNLFQGEVQLFTNDSKHYKPNDVMDSGTKYWAGTSGAQCYAFANAVYYYLFGVSPNHGDGSYSNSKKIPGVKGKSEISYSDLANAGVGCGAYIRTTGNSSGDYSGNAGHSMIILKYSNKNITVYEGNADGNGKIQVKTYTWDNFNYWKLKGYRNRYVAHIIQPNITANNPDPISLPEKPIIEGAAAPKSLSNGSSYTLKGDIYCKYAISEIQGTLYKCNSDGTKTVISTVTVTPNRTSYSLGSEPINKGLKFGDSRLNNSWCLYELKAKYNKNGMVYSKKLIYRFCKIGSPSSIQYSTPGVYQFTLDDETRSGPAESNSIVNECTRGTVVFVTECVLNSSNNGWFKLTDGSYVFGGDVEPVTWTESDLSGTYYFRRGAQTEVYPYEEGPNAKSYNKDAAVTIIAQLRNTKNALWYKLSDGSYVYSGYVCAHNYSWVRTKEPTATENGEEQYKCSICGDVSKTAIIEKLNASGSCGNNATWIFTNGKLTISGSGTMYDYANQSAVPWKTYQNSILEVVVGEGITNLGSYSFSGLTNLTKVTLPNSLSTIGVAAFQTCSSLNSVYLPEHLEEIQEYAFCRCTNLSSINIPDEVWMIKGYAFSYCTSLASIYFPDSVLNIQTGAFKGCSNLSDVRLPFGMPTISPECFSGCTYLREISIPNYVNAIGCGAFENCDSLTEVWIKSSNVTFDFHYEGTTTNPVFYQSDNAVIYCGEDSTVYTYAQQKGIPTVIVCGTCGDNASWGFGGEMLVIWSTGAGTGAIEDYEAPEDTPWWHLASSINQLYISDSITGIGKNAFAYDALTSVSLPDGLLSIGESAFQGCWSLSEINLPSTIQTIGDYAFRYCPIQNITIPASVSSIGHSVFLYCRNLEAISVAESNTTYCSMDGVLYSKDKKTLCDYPEGKRGEKYTIPEGVTVILWGAFENCDTLEEVIIPESVFYIGQYVFANCDSLVELTIPSAVRVIYDGTIADCVALRDVYISSSTTIYDYWEGVTFRGSPYLTIHAPAGSSAIDYAIRYGIAYEDTAIPVETIYTWGMEFEPGETGSVEYYVYPEDATNKKIVCEEVNNDICTITSDGTVYAKSNGYAYVTIHSAENPDIYGTGVIYVHSPINYSYSATVNDEGEIIIRFTGITNKKDKIAGFELYSLNALTNLNLIDAKLPGFSGNTKVQANNVNQEWVKQIFRICTNPAQNSVYADQEAVFRLLPDNIDDLWGTSQDYEFFFYPYYIYGSEYAVNQATIYFEVAINFPEKPTPLNNPDFMVPAGLTKIEEEAFAGIAAKRVKLGEYVMEIGANAFANCPNLMQIYIPEGCERISTTAFSGVSNLTIYGKDGSYAEWFASKRGLDFVAVE